MQSLKKHTGKELSEWIAILEKNGARSLAHKEITVFLKKKYKLRIWWQHQVASGYEEHIGRKLPGRNAKGLFSTTSVKTVAYPLKTVWAELLSPAGQEAWLKPLAAIRIKPKNQFEIEGGIFGEVRTMLAPKRIRLSWQDTEWPKPTFIQVQVYARAKDKCMIVIQHDSLTSAQLKEDLKNRWKRGIDDFIRHLESRRSVKKT